MTNFVLHTEATAPEASKPVIKRMMEDFGFLPNLTAIFAESPAMAEAYWALSDIFDKTDLTATEREVVLMTNNRLNRCTYCMAAHTTDAQMHKVPADVIEALRNGTPIADAKLEALRVFTIKVYETRGFVSDAEIEPFLAAGYTKANVLDVILGTGLKVLSNYTNHVADTPLDAVFQRNAWTADASAAA